MLQTWRWFGPDDPVPLGHVRQAGAAGVVSALDGRDQAMPWLAGDIERLKRLIENAGLTWSVVESVPIHPAIKLGGRDADRHIDAYVETVLNLATAGIHTICYNFMPVIDWTRTDLGFRLPSGALALRFDMVDLAAYDLFVLQRNDASKDYSNEIVSEAERRFRGLTDGQIAALQHNLIAGLPGSDHSHGFEDFRREVGRFGELSAGELRSNLIAFLSHVAPAVEEVGSRLCIHPDDPPFPLFGLPRVVSRYADFDQIFKAVPSPANGLTLCTGSLGVLAENDLMKFIDGFGDRIDFAHLRNIKRESGGSFYEADHLGGDVEMVSVVAALLDEEVRRVSSGREDWEIPMRPDHGHILLDDAGKKSNPGYSAIGRLKGLAELRGVIEALSRNREVRQFMAH